MSYLKKLFLLLLIFIQCSCVVAVIAGAAVAGVVIYDRRSINTMHDDVRIANEITQSIKSDQSFAKSRIVVVCFNRILLLTGQIPNEQLKNKLDQMARKNQSLYRIYDETTVSSPISFEQQAQDVLITSQVRTTLISTKHLESGSLRAVTENKVVYLMGIVTKDQADLAVEEVKLIPKVKQVVRVFQYIQ